MKQNVRPKRTLLTQLRAVLLAIGLVLAGVSGTVVVATPAVASTMTLCSGNSYSTCINAGHTDHGYEANSGTMYWKAFTGHNCTNYVGYMLTQNGDAGHGVAMGVAADWDDTIAAHPAWGYAMNSTAAVGSIAQWEANTGPATGSGHVAYVEAVSVSGGVTTITISEDNYDVGPFSWKTITSDGADWPSRFLHIKDASALPSGASPIQNGGFNTDTGHWSTSGSANLAYYTASSGNGTNPYEGAGYAATNAVQAGDSLSETNTVSVSPGDTWCASAKVVTVGNASGGSGTLAVWLTGGTTNDSSTYTFGGLPGNNDWQTAKTCVTATTAQSYVKVQFYPTAGMPTIGVDAVDVHQTLNANGGFNSGMDYWNAQSGTNRVAYAAADNTGTNPYEGFRFGATNTATSGGSIYQDLPRNIAPGDTFCTEAQVVTVGNTTGAAGALYVYLTGDTGTEESHSSFSSLAGGSSWKPIKTCVTATGAHTNVRVQLYPAVNSPTVGIDALDVHASIIQNGGFNVDSSHWGTTGGLSYMQYGSYSSTLPYEGSGFEVIQASSSADTLLEARGWSIGVGDTFCVDAQVITPGYGSGASGTLAIWLLGSNGAENSVISFSGLPGGNNWTPIKTCVTATIAEPNGTIKVQFYPTPGGAPVGVDAVDVH